MGSDPAWIEGRTRTVESDENGSYSFEETGAAEREVLWVTAAGLLGHGRILDGSEHDAGATALAASEPVRVSVVDPEGSPLVATEIIQWSAPAWTLPDEPEPWTAGLAGFSRRARTDGDGVAILGAMPADTQVRAIGAQGVSAVAQLRAGQTHLTLVVAPAFELVVSTSPQLEPEQYEGVGLEVWVWSDEWQLLVELPIDPRSGSPEPVDLPTLLGGYFLAKLVGGGLVTESVNFPEPTPGETVRIAFDLRGGQEVPVRVVGRDGDPLAGAVVDGSYEGSAGKMQETLEFITDENGRAILVGLPDGAITVRARSEDHVPAERSDVIVPTGEDVVVVLDRSGRLVGEVLHGGLPVKNFRILTWRDDPVASRLEHFEGREKGEFEVEDIAAGPLVVLAGAEGYGQSSPTVIEIAPGGEEFVTLELSAAAQAVGRVVDGVTGEPIEAAWVTPYMCLGEQLIAPHGDTVVTDRRGAFMLEAVPSGTAGAFVSAQGYRGTSYSASGEESGAFDFGVLPLFAGRTVLVSLVAPDGLDPASFTVFGGGGYSLPERTFDGEGRAIFEDVTPGFYTFIVLGPDRRGWKRSLDLHSCRADWSVELDIRGDARLLVELRGDVPAAGVLAVASEDPRYKRSVLLQEFTDERSIEVLGVPPGEAVLTVSDLSGELLASARLAVAAGSERAVELRISAERLAYRLVDGLGEPVPGAIVKIACRDAPLSWMVDCTARADGVFLVPGPPCDRLVGSTRNAGAGWGDVELPLPSPTGEPVDVVLDSRSRIDIVVRDGEQPIPGARVLLTGGRTRQPHAWKPTNDSGEVSFLQLTAGPQLVAVRQAGLWPTAMEVESSPERSRVEFQVRRVGDLEVRATGPNGEPSAWTPLEVENLELGQGVGPWIDAGLIWSSVTEPMTDAGGTLLLRGVPRGRYRVRAAGALDHWARIVTVIPGDAASVKLTVGE